MDIVFCIDNNYTNLLAIAINSILKNIKKDYSVNFFIMHKNMTNTNIRKIKSLVKNANKVYFIQVDENKLLADFTIPNNWTNKVCYYRLIAPQIIQEFKINNNLTEEEKLLYLDADIIVNGDISPIFDTDISKVAIGAVRSPLNIDELEHIPTLNLPEEHKYIYSGLLLYNIKNYLNDNIIEQAIKINQSYPNGLKWADMDMINMIFSPNKYVPILPKYSIFPGLDLTPYEHTIENYLRIYSGINSEDEIKDAFYNPIILQLAGGAKPWRGVSTLDTISLWAKYSMFTPFFIDGVKYLINKLMNKGT